MKHHCHSCKRLRLKKFVRRDTYDKTRWVCKDKYTEGSSCDRTCDQRRIQDFIVNDPWYGW